MPLFGSHLSVAGSFTKAIDEAARLKLQSLQIFTKAPNQWRGREISAEEAIDFRKAAKKAGLKRLLAHDSYLINLASPDPALYERSLAAFVEEIRRAELLGLHYLVTHPGAHMGEGEEPALRRVIGALDEALRQTAGAKVRVLIETTAGQGTHLGHRFEHLRTILRGVAERRRLGVCVDTCHILAAGYALGTRAEYDRTMREFGKVVGFSSLHALHLNDSLKPCGSRVDRHAHIGKGCVGEKAFGYVVNDPRLQGKAMILETAKENDMDRVNLRVLRRLWKRAPKPARSRSLKS